MDDETLESRPGFKNMAHEHILLSVQAFQNNRGG